MKGKGALSSRLLLGRQAPHQDFPGGRLQDAAAADHSLVEKLHQNLAAHGLQVRGKFQLGQQLKRGVGDGHPQEPVKLRLMLQQGFVRDTGSGLSPGRPSATGGPRLIFLRKAAHVVHGPLEALLHLVGHLLIHVEDRRALGHQVFLPLRLGPHVLHQKFSGGLDALPGDVPHMILPGGAGSPGRQDKGQPQAQGQEETKLGDPLIPGRRRGLAGQAAGPAGAQALQTEDMPNFGGRFFIRHGKAPPQRGAGAGGCHRPG